MINTQKVKVSKKEFAEVLYLWFSHRLTDEAIKGTAKDLDFKIKNNENFNKILQELFPLNMWLIVRACERLFEDEDKRNECLDIFHKFVYDRQTDKSEEKFSKWKKALGAKYSAYIDAMETEHPSGPVWVLSILVNKNLFGEVKEDPFLQVNIGAYIGILAENLEELIRKYEII